MVKAESLVHHQSVKFHLYRGLVHKKGMNSTEIHFDISKNEKRNAHAQTPWKEREPFFYDLTNNSR